MKKMIDFQNKHYVMQSYDYYRTEMEKTANQNTAQVKILSAAILTLADLFHAFLCVADERANLMCKQAEDEEDK